MGGNKATSRPKTAFSSSRASRNATSSSRSSETSRARRRFGLWAGCFASRHLTVTTFYCSNVERSLFRDNKWKAFYDSVGTLPLDDTSMFIRAFDKPAVRMSAGASPSSQASADADELLAPMKEFLAAYTAGGIKTYDDVAKLSKEPHNRRLVTRRHQIAAKGPVPSPGRFRQSQTARWIKPSERFGMYARPGAFVIMALSASCPFCCV